MILRPSPSTLLPRLHAFFFIGFLLGGFDLKAATITARSPSLADVSVAIASAVDGDTVIVPAGTAAWTSTLSITKGITFIGATTCNSDAGTCIDKTIIQDNVNPRALLISVTSSLGKSYRVSGLTFQQMITTKSAQSLIKLTGNSQSLRFDHCHFMPNGYVTDQVKVSGPIHGVFDHNVMDCIGSAGGGGERAFALVNGAWAGDGQGNAAWAAPTGFGTGNWFFVEDNYIINRSLELSGQFFPYVGSFDEDVAGSAVVRHNHLYDSFLGTHGTQSGPRGGRGYEIYNNDFHAVNGTGGSYFGTRSGPLISHDNTFDGHLLTGIGLSAFRASLMYGGTWNAAVPSHWDVADTSNGTFTNAANPALTGASNPTNSTGSFNYNPVNGLYDSGTVSSGSGTKLVDTTKTWATNQWQYFTARRLSDNATFFIDSNTSNTLTIYQAFESATPPLQANDQYEIRRMLIVLDQPCRGKSDLIKGRKATTTITSASNGVNVSSFTGSGVLNVNSTTGFASSGTLQINSKVTGGNVSFPLITYRGKTATSFTGCAAMSNASGVLATGQQIGGLYQGGLDTVTNTLTWPNQSLEPCYSWNDIYTPTNVHISIYAGPGNKGILHEGRDFFSNTPMPGYTPFTYPHPLVTGVPSPPSPPTNLRVVP